MSLRARIERRLSPKHLGRCFRCDRPWKSKATRMREPGVTTVLNRLRYFGLVGVDPHLTPYASGRNCFPLCAGCWSKLEPEERIPYYRDLVVSWLSSELDDRIELRRIVGDADRIFLAVRTGL